MIMANKNKTNLHITPLRPRGRRMKLRYEEYSGCLHPVESSVPFASNFEVEADSQYKIYHRTRRLPRPEEAYHWRNSNIS